MKNLITEISIHQNFKKIIISMLTLISLTACPGKNSGNDAPPPVTTTPPPVTNTCTSCVGISNPSVLVNQATSNGSYPVIFPIAISWQLIGDAAILANSLPASTPHGNYIGPVVARGGMTFPAQLSNYGNACVIPAGTYNFDTLTLGLASQGVIQISELQANGPVVFKFSLFNGTLYKPSGVGQDNIIGTILITSVNGVNCYNFGTGIN